MTRNASAAPVRRVWREEVAGFLLVGAVTTVVYLLLYVLLRPSLGEQVANLVALALTVDANTAANRRLSFGVRAEGARRREHAQASTPRRASCCDGTAGRARGTPRR